MAKLYEMLYGEDGASGMIGKLRNEGRIDMETYEKVKAYVEDLVEKTGNEPSFPGKDIAALCDMFIDLMANSDLDPKAVQCMDDLNLIIQKWY